jgi:hypothetical protein
VVAAPPLEARESHLLAPLDPLKESLVGLVEARQHILQDMRVDGLAFGERSAEGFEFGFLLET